MLCVLQVSIFVILLASSVGIPYYIRPSDGGNNTCFFEGRSLQPCSSLETLAGNNTSISSQDFGENLMLSFLPGRHVIKNNQHLNLSSFRALNFRPLKENGSSVKIKCIAEMTITFWYVNITVINSIEFSSCGKDVKNGKFLYLIGVISVMQILNSSFIGIKGSALYINSSSVNLTITESRFAFIKAKSRYCGAICLKKEDTTVDISANIKNTIFVNNSGGALSFWLTYYSTINITNSMFVGGNYRRQIYINYYYGINTTIANCVFHNNSGGIQITSDYFNYLSVLKITDCTFTNNTVFLEDGGGAISSDGNISITITNCIFVANTCEDQGGAINSYRYNQLTLVNATFRENFAIQGGAIYVYVKVEGTQMHLLGHSVFSSNSASNDGGAINVEGTQVHLLGHSEFSNNSASTGSGGAIFARQIEIYLNGFTMFFNNTAEESGGALNTENSRITFEGDLCIFENNSVSNRGGALFLSKSFLKIMSGELFFMRNHASLGGALYIEDFSNYCGGNIYHPCFFNYSNLTLHTIHFQENTAREGSVLYGGFLNTCNNRNGIQQFNELLSNEITGDSVTSNVIDVCFCNDQQGPNCSVRHKSVSAFRGQSIPLMVATVDQYENFIPSFIDHCKGPTPTLGEGECHYRTNNACTVVNTHIENIIHSKEAVNSFVINTGGFCKNMNNLTVEITFEPCPRGFQLAPSEDRCECDGRLDAPEIECFIDNQTIKTSGKYWFQYQNETLYVWKLCRWDYCNKNSTLVPITDVNDSQCVNNRARILCGKCRDTFSMALGSSQCIECSNSYLQYAFLWLVPLFAVLGLILVLTMLFINLTVSVGLINGLIFYANILSISGLINHYNCLVHPLLSVFISWVNLDFGIKTCFLSGMDMYQKTWLQFAFPLYIWLLVGLILILSHYSTRVMKLLGRRVIPVLATLFLLSYIKILRIVVTTFNFTMILAGDADNTSDELFPYKVWTHDGNVKYLSGKHIPLFIVALLFLLLLFLPYTLLLTFGQCLRTMSRRKGLRWLRSTVFISIMDAYHAPFNRKHRYWTGLLLLIRCFLLVIFVATYYNDNIIMKTNTYILLIVSAGLFVFKAFMKNSIFQRSLANIFENLFLLNLVLLTATVNYLQGTDQPSAVCKCFTASISLAFVTFCVIIVFHVCYKVKAYNTLQKIFNNKINAIRKVKATVKRLPPEPKENTATTTFVELREALLESTEHKN